MTLPKKTNPKESSAAVSLLRFFFRHVEKFVASAIIVAAAWFSLDTLHFQPLTWQPEDLVELADNTETAILAAAPVGIEGNIFDYAVYAEQIRERVPLVPYHYVGDWFPVILPSPPLRSGFEVLTAEFLRGEPLRRNVLPAQGTTAARWQRPVLPGVLNIANDASIWVNLYGTIPLGDQQTIYKQTFEHDAVSHRPEYAYYEIERAEELLNKQEEEPDWQLVVVYPGYTGEEQAKSSPDTSDTPDTLSNFFRNRLIPFQRGASQEAYAKSTLLFSDYDVEPGKMYAYRIRLYLVNPNYNLQSGSVEEGVDTHSEFLRSDWSHFARVYVPDRISVQLHSVTPGDVAEFPRQSASLRPSRGTLFLDYFDVELGQSLPLVEKTEVFRGMLGNMSKEEANRYINRDKKPEEFVNVNYPDEGLRSDVCVLDFSGGRPLQKRLTREAQASPSLSVAGKALVLLPNGTMQVITSEQR